MACLNDLTGSQNSLLTSLLFTMSKSYSQKPGMDLWDEPKCQSREKVGLQLKQTNENHVNNNFRKGHCDNGQESLSNRICAGAICEDVVIK